MTEALEKYNQFHRELVHENLAKMKREIERSQEALSNYESRMEGIDHISYWDMENPEGVHDVEDRKRLVNYFYENLGRNAFKSDVVKCGIFWHWSNIPQLCQYRNIECPEWFIKKYQK